MKKIKAIITTIWMAFPLLGTSQNNDLPKIQWNAIKVFDLGLDQVYNLYIDTLGFNGVETVICFQTKTGQLIKTDLDGNILKTGNNPYSYFTSYKGDTLIIKGANIINEKGDTVSKLSDKYTYSYIAASQSSIYIQVLIEEVFSTYGGVIDAVVGYEKGSLRTSTDLYNTLSGLCCSEGLIFDVISSTDAKGFLQYRKDDDLNNTSRSDIPVNNPAGVGVYEDYLYVYSNEDKALYKLLTHDSLGISAIKELTAPEEVEEDYQETIYPLDLNFIAAPNKMFVKKVDGVSNDYIVSLLEEQFDGNYKITGWYGSFCKVEVEDSLIDAAITELLKNDSVMITRRIYYSKSDYEFKVKNGYPIDEYSEMCIFSGISYGIRKKYNQNTVDSLAIVYGLTNTPNRYIPEQAGMLSVPKTADIFDIAQKLYDTECFTYISLDMHMKINMHETSIRKIDSEQKEILETQYYNLSGQRISTPSGLTIVVTRYSDGTVRSEKGLFR